MKSFSALDVLIVDDEPPARERIRNLLVKMAGIQSIAMADDGDSAVLAILRNDPDIVFLDIQLPDMTGLDVVRKIGPDNMPITIFVTAYDQHALKAFELCALDYLLKPFENERFEHALQRAKSVFELNQSHDRALRVRRALELLAPDALDGGPSHSASSPYMERIAVESRSQVRMVLTQQIDYITASGVYAELHIGDKTYLVRERMQELEGRLDPRNFFRIHRSAIVQLDRIDVLTRHGGGDYMLKLRNGVQLTVSRSRIEQLERWMGVLNSHA